MARCGCSGTTCSCRVIGGGQVVVTGSGSAANPYIVSVESAITVADTGTLDLSITGSGTSGDPYVLSGDVVLSANDLTDVDLSNNTPGYVLALQGDGTLALVPAATASPGAINTGDGITGDGSAGSPLTIELASGSGLILDSNGLSASWVLMPSPVVDQEDADYVIVAKGTSGTTSRITNLVASITNPSPSATILVKAEQRGSVRIEGNVINSTAVVWCQPDVVGGSEVSYSASRVQSYNWPGSQRNIGVYQSYLSHSYVALGPGETVTVYGRAWTSTNLDSDEMSLAKPLVRYNRLHLIPVSTIDPSGL